MTTAKALSFQTAYFDFVLFQRLALLAGAHLSRLPLQMKSRGLLTLVGIEVMLDVLGSLPSGRAFDMV